jgi:hypothetical protein
MNELEKSYMIKISENGQSENQAAEPLYLHYYRKKSNNKELAVTGRSPTTKIIRPAGKLNS